MDKRVVPLLIVFAMLVTGCSRSDSGNEAPTGPAPTAATGTAANSDGSAIELTPSPEGFPLGLSTSQGFALQLFDTPGADQGFKKFPPETGAKRHFDEFTIAGHRHLVITEDSDPPKYQGQRQGPA